MYSLIIVDDNEVLCQGIKDHMDWQALDIMVLGTCTNGQDGYDMAQRMHPDIVITDVDMPIMTGLEMASKLKSEFDEMDFIFISCFDDFHFIQEAMDMKAFKYVLKPIIFSDLTNSIEQLCTEKNKRNLYQAQYEEMKKNMEKHAIFLRECFYRDLVYGRLQKEEDILAQMEHLDIDMQLKEIVIVFIEIRENDLHAKENEQRLPITETIADIFVQNQMVGIQAYLIEKNATNISYVLILNESYYQLLENEMQQFKEMVNQKVHCAITVGISAPSSQILHAPKLFIMACQAVKHRFYSKDKSIIFYSDMKQSFAETQVDLFAIKSEVKKALSDGYKEIISRYYDVPFTSEENNYGMRENAVRTLTFMIANYVQAEMIERGFRKKYTLEEETDVWETLLLLETVDDLKSWLIDIIEKAQSEINNQKDNRYGAIVDNIKQIIHESFGIVKNVEQIVKPLHISPSHANLIFKTQTGISIFDYLTKTRMKEAEKMLLDPYLKIYEIVEKVGYTNYSYFAATFKEYTGFAPKQFRKTHVAFEDGGENVF